jgi:Kef-type K+ transport system membrane component KefB
MNVTRALVDLLKAPGALNVTRGLVDLLIVTLVAAVAPLVAAVPRLRVPQVIIFLVGGILIGEHGLGVVATPGIRLLSNVGLGFLFLLAGYELEPRPLRQEPGRLAVAGWLISAAVAVGVVTVMASISYIRDYVAVGLALTTTALGTLLPELRENDMLGGRFGRHVLAAGAAGEIFPVIAISVFLTQRNHLAALAAVLLVGLVALALTLVPWLTRSAAIQRIIAESQDAAAQTTLRWSAVLLFGLLAIASRFGLDIVLGAMLAGVVLRNWTRRIHMDTTGLERKFDAVGYGLFIPLFFVVSGMTLDLEAIAADPLRVVIFFLLLLGVRGLPSLLVYRRVLPMRQRVEMTFITATTMPLLLALAEIGLRDGVMPPATAAALAASGVLSVMVFPSVAVLVARQGQRVSRAPPRSAP